MVKRKLTIKKQDDAKSLERFEQETIITFNKESPIAEVFTYEYRWIRHMEEKLGLKPKYDNGFGGRAYEIPKKLISKPKAPKAKRVLTEEQRNVLRERMRHARGS